MLCNIGSISVSVGVTVEKIESRKIRYQVTVTLSLLIAKSSKDLQRSEVDPILTVMVPSNLFETDKPKAFA